MLFHGLTNSPAQYVEFAPLLHARGINVFVPRLPAHGDRDRLTASIATITAEILLRAATVSVEIGSGLGERLAVLGISMGGLLAAYFAQFAPIARSVPVAPSFALLHLPYVVSRFVERVALALPNRFYWWAPRIRAGEPPVTAYPRFSTHALMQSLRIGDAVYDEARRRAPLAQRIVTVVNPRDPAVNNAVSKRVAGLWSAWNPGRVEYLELTGLPRRHDIVDPAQPKAATSLVYPKLLQALGISITA